MFLLYLDDAGSVGSASETHFILSGICVFERQVHYLTRKLDDLASTIYPQSPQDLEFHGSHILPGKGFWRSIKDRSARRAVLQNALSVATDLRGDWALFGVVVEKAALAGEDPVEYAFEHIVTRFDAYLKRLHRKGNTHRGLIILDKSTQETRLQSLARDFRINGSRWGSVTNLADVPMFVDSAATRAVQYADLVSYALWQAYEKGDISFLAPLIGQFDREGAVLHGLHHKTAASQPCPCATCAAVIIGERQL
jgi:Protein of unknown function (DUF3800)